MEKNTEPKSITTAISVSVLGDTYCCGAWLGSQSEDDKIYAVEYHPDLIWIETQHYADNNTIEINKSYGLWTNAAINAYKEYNS